MNETEVVTAIAVFTERIARMEKALELQAAEVKRRLAELNHENQRVNEVQARTVTAEKFDDYVATQQRALDVALSSIQDKIATRVESSQEVQKSLSDRLLHLEGEFRAMQDAAAVRIGKRSRGVDRLNTWLVAGMGVFISLVVLLANVVL